MEQLKNQVRYHLKGVLEKALEWERDQQIQALRYERGVMDRTDYRNGYRERSLSTTMGTVDLRVPRGRRALTFTTFEAYKRRWPELDALLLEAHIGGMSCQQVGERLAPLLGRSWSRSTIAKLKQALIDQLKAFKHAPLQDVYVGLILDGMYVRIRQCGARKRPVIAIIGVRVDGRCDLLGLRVCYSENSTEVEGILRHVKERGVRGVNLEVVTIDGDKGLEAAVYAVYGHVRVQDCIFHRINRLHRNAKGKVRARRMMTEASEAFKEANPRSRRQKLDGFIDRWREKEPEAIASFETRLDRCFEADALPAVARCRCTTTGLCEGLFKQLRRRIKQIGPFETPQAVELYIFAVLCQKKWIVLPGRNPAAPLLNEFTH
jgi:transposase-like protein